MDGALSWIIFLELLFTLGDVYGILHESALIRFEHRIAATVRRGLANLKAQRERKAQQKLIEHAVYTPVKPGNRTDRSDSGVAA